MQNSGDDLHRGLEERHVSLMALGAAIGVGLFLGSATAIKLAGPAILISYVVCGLAIFVIMRALGEMAVHNPVSGSFSRYARDYIGPLAGYLTGWTYWFMWIVTCMAEISAVGVYMHVWYPDIPNWIWALAALVLMGSINFIAVKMYGELEFWFALVKVATIILMIVSGFGAIFFGIGNGGVATGLHNLWTNGGFFPHGLSGLMLALPMVAFSYGGIEMLGLTAGEAKNPKKSLSRAVNSVFWRILIFYVGALFVIMAIYPWNEIGSQGSPFVMLFDRMGVPAAAGIVNFVVLTAALSSCNSGIFSTGRMLFNLAQQGQAPASLANTSDNGVPRRAILISVALLFVGVALNYLAPTEVFTWLSAISAFSSVWTWGVILLAQIGFRKSVSRSEVNRMTLRVPFFPYTSYLAGLFLVAVLIVMAFHSDTKIALIVGPAWIALLVVLYYVRGYSRASADVRAKEVASR
ncbi:MULTISPECIES: amino acid permease [Burkholderia]|uniref:Amino acid permease n=1 Tax=Burkholderia contaminans TaxID=488447 RepID=A0A2S5DVS1_9BURK|nr:MULTISPECIES: amino acid permease [Burkholderia]EKS9795327.1 amino acid permease [Burkholderia cepacia]EKS9807594.1 amino acid permease [Burkholderia cepacia]EKS9815153.1 amino acid permease [Burkholderia cepacia]EKS9822865.1 amino acid permease [Burkholderia cepacia]EKS9830219.1 amino acid permease [Burkholderia cepacia]